MQIVKPPKLKKEKMKREINLDVTRFNIYVLEEKPTNLIFVDSTFSKTGEVYLGRVVDRNTVLLYEYRKIDEKGGWGTYSAYYKPVLGKEVRDMIFERQSKLGPTDAKMSGTTIHRVFFPPSTTLINKKYSNTQLCNTGRAGFRLQVVDSLIGVGGINDSSNIRFHKIDDFDSVVDLNFLEAELISPKSQDVVELLDGLKLKLEDVSFSFCPPTAMCPNGTTWKINLFVLKNNSLKKLSNTTLDDQRPMIQLRIDDSIYLLNTFVNEDDRFTFTVDQLK